MVCDDSPGGPSSFLKVLPSSGATCMPVRGAGWKRPRRVLGPLGAEVTWGCSGLEVRVASELTRWQDLRTW